eukprot:UN21553
MQIFEYLNKLLTPADMCYCLRDTVETTYSIANHYERTNTKYNVKKQNSIIGADDFIPIFLYVVIQSNVSGLHRVIHILNHYNSPLDMKSEIGP